MTGTGQLIFERNLKIVTIGDVPQDINIVGGRVVLAVKVEATNREIWKARSVVQYYRVRLKA